MQLYLFRRHSILEAQWFYDGWSETLPDRPTWHFLSNANA
jgi:hypothetical protein